MNILSGHISFILKLQEVQISYRILEHFGNFEKISPLEFRPLSNTNLFKTTSLAALYNACRSINDDVYGITNHEINYYRFQSAILKDTPLEHAVYVNLHGSLKMYGYESHL